MPMEAAELVARAFRQRPILMMYKYDDQDRVIEELTDMAVRVRENGFFL